MAKTPVKGKAAPPKKSKVEAEAPVVKKGAAAKKEAAPKKKAAAKMAAAPVKKSSPKMKASAVKRPAPKKGIVRVVVVGKKAAPRRAATRVAVLAPAPRRGGTAGAARKVPATSLSKAGALRKVGTQVYAVSHLNEAGFKADGLRPYALYRDLGIAAATSGLCQAHVIRFVPPCTDEVRKRHLHEAELQLVYVLQGWMKNEFEGVGEQMMSAGSCWIQPSGIEHTVLDYSPDCEVLEIIVPADFKTEEV